MNYEQINEKKRRKNHEKCLPTDKKKTNQNHGKIQISNLRQFDRT